MCEERENVMTYGDLYRRGKMLLTEVGIGEAGLESRLLLEHVCGTCRNDLLVHEEEQVDTEKEMVYEELIRQRRTRIPLQHLTGVQEFMGLTFSVNEHVLIPRQDTEILVEEVLRNLHDGMRVLDLCTGSGCILISLLHYSNHCTGVGTDLSEEALAVAVGNGERLLGNIPEEQEGFGGIRFLRSNLFEHVEGKFDVIVSNPPYIRRDVIPTLMPEVREYEPMMALDGGEDGLDFYRTIIRESKNYLYGGGMLFLEIGYDQKEEVASLMRQAGFREVETVKDYAGLDRVVYGIRPFD